jgi:predicted RecA/RadA family phage recombinase
MRNYISSGATITAVLTAAVASGGGVVLGDLFGVANTAGDAGETVELETVGVFSLPKVEAEVWTFGAPVYFDPVDLVATIDPDRDSVGDTLAVLIGHAVDVSPPGAGVATGAVRLSI